MSTQRSRRNRDEDQVTPKDLGTSSDRAMYDAPRGPSEPGDAGKSSQGGSDE